MFDIDNKASLVTLVLALVVAVSLFRRTRDLDHIPTVGFSNPLLSWISALRYLISAKSIVYEGYTHYPTTSFKISTLDAWCVVVNDFEKIEDLRRANFDHLSSSALVSGLLQYEHIFGKEFVSNPYHFHVVRGTMTRSIASRYAEVRDIVEPAYRAGIQAKPGEWVAVPAYKLQLDTVCKLASKFFAGDLLCEDKGVRDILESATLEIFKGHIVQLFPELLKPLAARVFTNVHALRRRINAHLEPILAFRRQQMAIHGPGWSEKPDDLISWMIDAANEGDKGWTVDAIGTRLLFLSFTAMHTSSATFTAALYQLCLQPTDAAALRAEIQTLIDEEGWTKEAFDKMPLLDSFIRESQRVHPISLVTVARIALKDFTFSDGTFIPKGTTVAVNSNCVQHDESVYPEAEKFIAHRFVQADGSDEKDGASRKLAVTPTLDYFPFGLGREACPGRFFAMTLIKVMLAHLVLNYDVKLPMDKYPAKVVFETFQLPNKNAKVLFRRRI